MAMVGCTNDSDDPPAADNGSSEAQETGSGSVGGNAEPPTPFGEAYSYDQGTVVTVGTPSPFTPSRKALAGGEPEFVTVELTVDNGSDAPVAPAEVFVTVESDGQQAGEVLDPKNELNGPPKQPVKPGASRSWKVGYGVYDATDVTVQVQLGLDEEPVIFRTED
jgi:hypothetical protein